MPVHTSFRDPSGYVTIEEERVLRYIDQKEVHHFLSVLESPALKKFVADKKIVSTHSFTQFNTDDGSMIVEHEKIDFPSYPYEWCPEMLRAAGALTLDLADQFLNEDFGIKDATPFNILFTGTAPVFVDLLSIEKRSPFNPVWLPCSQFISSFLLPLLANKKLGVPLNSIFLTQREGMKSEELFQMAGGLSLLTPSFFSLVTLPVLFSKCLKGKTNNLYKERLLSDPEKAKYIFRSLLHRLRKHLKQCGSNCASGSHWTAYMAKAESYSQEQFDHKQELVGKILEQAEPMRVLDIGCNTGHFSILAARKGAKVVAIDRDSAVISELWQNAKKSELDILPLVIDIGRPSPAAGWRYQEHFSFLDRAGKHFDCVFMLAILHHLLVQERIPMQKIAELASQLTRNGLIIEYVGKKDLKFREIARGRDHLFTHISEGYFESAFSLFFTIKEKHKIHHSHRILYWMKVHS